MDTKRKVKRRLPLIEEEAMAFQPDTVEVEQRRLPRPARWALYGIFGLFAFCVIWASLAQVDRIVQTTGKLVETGNRIVVQPLTTSVIRSIDVKTGDVVRKGQILARLDPTFSQADVEQARGELQSVMQEIEKTKAELEGPSKVTPIEISQPQRGRPGSKLTSREQAVRDAISGLQESRRAVSEGQGQLAVLAQITAMRKKLYELGYGAKLQYLEALHEQQRYQTELENRLLDATRRRDKLLQELSKAVRLDELGQLRAVEDAVVLDVVQKSTGSVVQAAEPVVTLVALDTPLEVEVNIPARDIGWTKVGDRARIKLDAFPFQQHGTLNGIVRVISPDAFTEQAPKDKETGQPVAGTHPQAVYRAKIEITENHLRKIPKSFQLIPGMAVAAEIKVGKRSVISYFFDPILKALDESIREPR